MRKTVQEWMDANQQSNGPAKKKIAAIKRSKRFPGAGANENASAGAKRQTKKKDIGVKKRRPK
jgi:hypothetical protein